jgi:nucleotide-binding universal stress UspA family protein
MFKHIVVGFDGSKASEKALDMAVEVARKFGARISLVAVFDLLPAFPLEAYGLTAQQVGAQEMERLLAVVTAAAKKVQTVTVTPAMENGHPAVALCEFANKQKADLLVVGSRGLGAVGRFMLGSVSDRVTHLAQCPVLVVRQDAEETGIPMTGAPVRP